jgi:cystathionine gamma-synthase
LLFPSPEAAAACRRFITAPKRTDGLESFSPDEVSIRAFELHLRVYGVFFPATKIPLVMPFWTNAGTGISSRLAEESLKHIGLLHELAESDMPPKDEDSPSQQALCQRIADLLERAPVSPRWQAKVSPGDVYLYQSGMAVIFYVHEYLLQWRNSKSKTVMFGFPFHSTIHIFEYWGPGVEFLPLGTELETLEKFLESEASVGRPVQAVWTEFPSNPLLLNSDLTRLRQLADKYCFALVVDDTIGSFCNVDVLGAADIVVTSLTKSFSGYADVLGGSAVLNPSLPLYSELKPLFQKYYHSDLYSGDAETLLHNSEDYLYRSKILNDNAALLVDYLQSLTSDPKSSVTHVYYPTASPTLSNYDAYKRPSTPDFQPGYGCLFSVEFDNVESTIAFYDNLHVHHGPHLGAHRTLALPYVKALYNDELEKVKKYGLEETQIRVAVGLEDPQSLLETFKHAVRMADAAKGRE